VKGGQPAARRRRPPSQRNGERLGTRIAFTVIVLFVLAQVGWWLIFQMQLLDRAATEREAAWERDVATVTALVADDPGSLQGWLERYPHLRVGAPRPDGSLAVEVDPAVADRLAARDDSARRMIAFEGPFFAVVILAMLALIAGSLRAERELKRRQQNFLSAVTHEFNTPIGTLRLLVQTLRLRRASPERTVDYLRRMETELDRLERTSDHVLAAARLEQTDSPPVLEAADLNVVVQGLVGRAREGLEARGARLTVRYGHEPLPVSLDPDAFALVLNNLLDNAVKYGTGDVKPVTVTLRADGDLVRLHVDDEGPGVPAEERERVFERFYRAGDELTRVSVGVGLGLHLVKTVTEAMNGWVQVEPGPGGRGSRFTVVLPRRVAADDAAPALGDPGAVASA
jgi:two-component system, OmpR family, sensor histidine kinase SenX3